MSTERLWFDTEFQMDEAWLREWIAAHQWKFASTMAANPHWYTQRRQARSDAEFDRAVDDIRKYGVPIYFRGTKYICYFIDGYKYWPMGIGGSSTPTRMQFLINRNVDERHGATDRSTQ